jgi:protein-disulfide isomerase
VRRAAFVLVLLALAGCGGGDDSGERAKDDGEKPLRGEASLGERFDGIPQHRSILGKRDAPFTLVEFADLQCPFCARFDRAVLPAVIERFVRPGRLRLDLRPVAFLGPDSSTGAAATVAAGFQNRMWQFADLFYRNQGTENSGYATPRFLGRIADAAGLDFDRWQRQSNSRRLVAILERNAREAQTARIGGTPGFRVGPTGGVLVPFEAPSGDRREFVRRLVAALRG